MPVPLIPIGFAIGSAIANYLANRKKARTQEQDLYSTQAQTQNIDFTTESMPQYGPEQEDFLQQLIEQYMRQLRQDPSTLADSITTAGVQAANIGGRARRTGMENLMAARGLSYSPAGASSIANVETQRIGDIIRLLSQRPQIIDQIRRANLNQAGQFFGRIPYGTRETRRGTTSSFSSGRNWGTVVPGASPAGAAVTGGVSTLGMMYGLGAFNQNQPSTRRPADDPYTYDPVAEGYNP